jgi:acetyltransferase-like isoleucine patch superfamily enzyme
MKKILYNFYHSNKVGKYIMNKIVIHEGGEKTSKTLREYFEYLNIYVGLYTYGSCFSESFNLGGHGNVNIGNYCSIASNVHFLSGNHPINYSCSSPYFYNKSWAKFDVKDIERSSLNIGNDVWIGQNVLITGKCHNIGNGAVIGAGSIVTKDVPPYSIVAGNPAKILKMRFDKKEIYDLEKCEWWNFSPNELIKFYDVISNPIEFSKRVENLKDQI